MTDTDQYVSFSDWFNEPEGYALRGERFDGDVEWLKAAFAAGQSCPKPLSASPKGDDLEPVARAESAERAWMEASGAMDEWRARALNAEAHLEDAGKRIAELSDAYTKALSENATLKREMTDKAQAWDAIAEKNATIATLKREIAELREARVPNAEEIERIILRTEPDVPASVDGDKVWTRRMAVALHRALTQGGK